MSLDYKLIPFQLSHLELMDLRPQEKEELHADLNLLQKVNVLAELGMGWTLLSEGRIVCAAGWLRIHAGVYEIWAFPSVYVKEPKYGRLYLRQLRKFRTLLEDEFKPHRIQSMSLDDPETDAFMKFCGFTQEGVLPMYSVTKRQYKMWGRTYVLPE